MSAEARTVEEITLLQVAPVPIPFTPAPAFYEPPMVVVPPMIDLNAMNAAVHVGVPDAP